MEITTNIAYKTVYTYSYHFEIDSKPKYYGWVGWSYKCPVFTTIENFEILPQSNSRFQEGDVVDYLDGDNTRYSVQHEVHARATRIYTPPGQNTYKDIIGHSISAVAQTDDVNRGVSGLGVTVRQFGKGIASNEFHCVNPEEASNVSSSMASVQGVCKPQKRSCDPTHQFRAVEAVTCSKKSTAAFMSRSVSDEYGEGLVENAIDLSRTKVAPGGVAIRMPQSSIYSEGNVIEYAPGCYTVFDRFNKKFIFVIDNQVALIIGKNGIE